MVGGCTRSSKVTVLHSHMFLFVVSRALTASSVTSWLIHQLQQMDVGVEVKWYIYCVQSSNIVVINCTGLLR